MVGMVLHLAVGVLLATGGSALANVFATHGHWTVLSWPNACAALNRPAEEWNFAPFNALSVRQRRDAQPVLQVFLWPNALPTGQAVTIRITIGHERIELPAEAMSGYLAESRGPLPAALIALLPGARLAEIKLSAASELLAFDISQLAAALASVDACVRQLPNR
jgi:hypothetical protein